MYSFYWKYWKFLFIRTQESSRPFNKITWGLSGSADGWTNVSQSYSIWWALKHSVKYILLKHTKCIFQLLNNKCDFANKNNNTNDQHTYVALKLQQTLSYLTVNVHKSDYKNYYNLIYIYTYININSTEVTHFYQS